MLGIAYRPDGTVASRFSDEVTLDMEKDQWEKFMQAPMQYQNQFSVAPGQYRLSVVVSGGGDKFAKFEIPVVGGSLRWQEIQPQRRGVEQSIPASF